VNGAADYQRKAAGKKKPLGGEGLYRVNPVKHLGEMKVQEDLHSGLCIPRANFKKPLESLKNAGLQAENTAVGPCTQ
jgi:hypothetical protein